MSQTPTKGSSLATNGEDEGCIFLRKFDEDIRDPIHDSFNFILPKKGDLEDPANAAGPNVNMTEDMNNKPCYREDWIS